MNFEGRDHQHICQQHIDFEGRGTINTYVNKIWTLKAETINTYVNKIWTLKAERPSTHMSTKYEL